MKSLMSYAFAVSIVLTSVNSVLASEASDAWQEQWFKAKYGHNTPREEARLAAERKVTAEPRAISGSASSKSWL